MAVLVQDLQVGPFTATGADQLVFFDFMVLTPGELQVIKSAEVEGEVVETAVSPSLYTVNLDDDILGRRIEGGSVLVAENALGAGDTFYVRALPRFNQESIWTNQGSRIDALNEVLDRLTLIGLWLRQFGGGGSGGGGPGQPGGLTPEEAAALAAALALKANTNASNINVDAYRAALGITEEGEVIPPEVIALINAKADLNATNIDVEAWLAKLGIDPSGDVDLTPVYAAIEARARIVDLPTKAVALVDTMTPGQIRQAIQQALDADVGKYATLIPKRPSGDGLWPVDTEIRLNSFNQLVSVSRKGAGLRLAGPADGVTALATRCLVVNKNWTATNRTGPVDTNIKIANIELNGNVQRFMTPTTAVWNVGTLAPGATVSRTVNVAGLTTSSRVYVSWQGGLPPDVRLRWSLATGVVTIFMDHCTSYESVEIGTGTVQVEVYSYTTENQCAAILFSGVHDSVISNVFAHDHCNHALNIDGGDNMAMSTADIRAGLWNYAKVLSRNIIVEDSLFSKGFDDNVTTHGCDGIVFANVHSFDSKGDGNNNGFEIDDWSRNVMLVNCSSKNCSSGLEIKAHNHSAAPRGVIVANFVCENSWQIGVNCYHAGNSAPVGGDPPYTPASKSGAWVTITGLRVYNPLSAALYLTDFSGIQVQGANLIAGPQSTNPSYTAALWIETASDCMVSNVLVTGFSNYVYGVYIAGASQQRLTVNHVTTYKSGKLGGFYMTSVQDGLSLTGCRAVAPNVLNPNSFAFGSAADALFDDLTVTDCRNYGYERSAAFAGRSWTGKTPDIRGGLINHIGDYLEVRRASTGRHLLLSRSAGSATVPAFQVGSSTSYTRLQTFEDKDMRFGRAPLDLEAGTVDQWGIIADPVDANRDGTLYSLQKGDIGTALSWAGHVWNAGLKIRNNPSSEGGKFGVVPPTVAGWFQIYALDGALKVKLPGGQTATLNYTLDP